VILNPVVMLFEDIIQFNKNIPPQIKELIEKQRIEAPL